MRFTNWLSISKNLSVSLLLIAASCKNNETSKTKVDEAVTPDKVELAKTVIEFHPDFLQALKKDKYKVGSNQVNRIDAYNLKNELESMYELVITKESKVLIQFKVRDLPNSLDKEVILIAHNEYHDWPIGIMNDEGVSLCIKEKKKKCEYTIDEKGVIEEILPLKETDDSPENKMENLISP